MPIIIAGCVDPVLIFSFLGAVVVALITGLVALLGRFKLPERRMSFSWISTASGAVVVVIAGQDGAFGGPEGLLFTIPLALGIISLLRCRQARPPTTTDAPEAT